MTDPTPQDAESVLALVRALHVSDDRWGCGMVSPEPVEVQHQFSGQVSTVVLRCSEERGHDGDHKDGACCWRAHYFVDAVEGAPQDRRTCSCGKRWSKCKTAQALETLPGDVDDRLRAMEAHVAEVDRDALRTQNQLDSTASLLARRDAELAEARAALAAAQAAVRTAGIEAAHRRRARAHLTDALALLEETRG